MLETSAQSKARQVKKEKLNEKNKLQPSKYERRIVKDPSGFQSDPSGFLPPIKQQQQQQQTKQQQTNLFTYFPTTEKMPEDMEHSFSSSSVVLPSININTKDVPENMEDSSTSSPYRKNPKLSSMNTTSEHPIM